MTNQGEIVDTRVRIPKELYERIKALAVRDRRSINSEMVVLLERAVRSAERETEEEDIQMPELVAA